MAKKGGKKAKKKLPEGFIKSQGRLARISKEELKKTGAKGGRKSKRQASYKKCDECKSSRTCPDFEEGAKCAVQLRIKKLATSPPSKVFTDMGFHDSKVFFENLSKDMAYVKECVLLERGPSAKKMMGYIDRLTALAKLMYGEKHLNLNVNAEVGNVLDLEKIVKGERQSTSYNPKTGEVGGDESD